jgi:hypothetical protein
LLGGVACGRVVPVTLNGNAGSGGGTAGNGGGAGNAPPAQLAFLVQPSAVQVGTPIMPAVQVALEDSTGNVVDLSGVGVSLSLISGSAAASLNGSITVTTVAGIAQFGDLSVGTVGTGFTLSATASGFHRTSSAFNVTATAPPKLSFAAAPQGGTVHSTLPAVQVSLNDPTGTRLASATDTVTLSLLGGTSAGALNGTLMVAATGGLATFSDLSIYQPGSYTFSATAPGYSGATSGSFAIVAGAADASHSSLTASAPAASGSSESSTLTVTLVDAYGDPISGQSITFSADGSNNTFVPSAGTTDAIGQVVATLSTTVGGRRTVTATGAGISLQTPVVFSFPVSGALSSLTATPASVTADGTATATLLVTLRDMNANPVAGQTVNLSASGSANTVTPPTGVTGADGTFSATLASTKAELKTVTATAGATLTQQVTFVAGPVANPRITAVPSMAAAIGTAIITITVQTADAHGNPIAGAQVSWSATGSNNTFTFASTTDANGLAKAQLSSTKAEAKTVTAIVLAHTLPITVNFTSLTCTGTLLLPGRPWATLTGAPADIAFADFNHDGRLDIVAATSQGVDVLLEDPGGVYSQPHVFASDQYFTGVATGDWNGDGKVDIAAAGGSSVMVWLGDGTGGFTSGPAVTFASAGVMAAGDFNGDGKLDLAATQATGVVILTGVGDGSFSAGTQVVGAAQSLGVANFNGDTYDDLVAVLPNAMDVTVLLGQSGGLQVNHQYPFAQTYVIGLAMADFNGDGHLDLAVGDEAAGQVNIMLGTGTGTFTTTSPDSVGGSSVRGAAAGDFDGDGKPDLMVGDIYSGQLWLLLNQGSGTFGAPLPFPVQFNDNIMFRMQAHDLNGDGLADIQVLPNSDTWIVLQESAGHGAFVAPAPVSNFPSGTAGGGVLADMNGDGHLDLVVAMSSLNNVSVMHGMGNGTFANPVAYSTGTGPQGLVVRDFDGDGLMDVLTANATGNSLSLVPGSAPTMRLDSLLGNTGTTPYALAVADLNGDGHLDVVTANYLNNSVTELFGDGHGHFTAQTPFSLPAAVDPRSIALGDLDHDGFLDIAVGGLGGTAILRGTGGGAFAAPTVYNGDAVVAIADLNHDGIADLATAWRGVHVELGTSSGMGTSAMYPIGGNVSAILPVDLNGDGNIDLVLAEEEAVVAVMINAGDGTFPSMLYYAAGTAPTQVAAGDVDGEGHTDLAVVGYGAATIMLSSGCVN